MARLYCGYENRARARISSTATFFLKSVSRYRRRLCAPADLKRTYWSMLQETRVASTAVHNVSARLLESFMKCKPKVSANLTMRRLGFFVKTNK